jgi:dihydrofolate reductase
MIQINLIWAQARERVIGSKGEMPWHLPEDLAHLKELTLGHPVIMGRKTWDSLPARFRPLPGRTNIVITRQQDWRANGAEVAHNLEEALQICEHISTKPSEVWILGGAQIFTQALPLGHRIEMTQIDEKIQGDTFAPALGTEWKETVREIKRSKTGTMFSFVTYIRS